jgi:hypothetical protein
MNSNGQNEIVRVSISGSQLYYENDIESYNGIQPIIMRAFNNHLVILSQIDD